eukprot:CAMPEP_0172449324 /NCGR_PEP_ID=MMETSP1065-20121228/8067_1 /TAXON_ID=265537 /ORGANISM="Amphiprora paludosa, Strain CCMP125" /LENGTH=414 /DNA_ID=CAMNT_0013200981 /DNA_START=29 /DNA_END=1273 /DNA_ORIENTATION=+
MTRSSNKDTNSSSCLRVGAPLSLVACWGAWVLWQNPKSDPADSSLLRSPGASLESSLLSFANPEPKQQRANHGSSSPASPNDQTSPQQSNSLRTRVSDSIWSPSNPLVVPQGRAPNLPRIEVVDSQQTDQKRKDYVKYGGDGDGSHLGGFTEFDLHGLSPSTWRGMVENLNVHSLMDVGCGRGVSTSWFADHGVDVLCVEGSHDAKHQSVLDDPETQMVEHDYSRGPWWPEKTYDAVWSVEFLEHVGLNNQFNYISTFRKAALLFVSSSRWGGWHHVEVHEDDWWILKYESYGFRFSDKLTQQVRGWARKEMRLGEEIAPNGESYNGQHIWLTMKVFVNPEVAALPEHAHLFAEAGCATKLYSPDKACPELEPSVKKSQSSKTPIALSPDMDEKWMSRIKSSIKQPLKSEVAKE